MDKDEFIELPVDYHKLHWSEKRTIREEYMRIQDGLCYHCKGPLNTHPPKEITDKPVNKARFPEGFFDWPVHLHHNHTTGLTIGAVHNYCNAVLWQYHGE